MDNIFILHLKNKNITPEENKALIPIEKNEIQNDKSIKKGEENKNEIINNKTDNIEDKTEIKETLDLTNETNPNPKETPKDFYPSRNEYKNNELNYSVTTETENNISIENINSINIIAEKNSINEKPHNFRPPPAADKKPIKNISKYKIEDLSQFKLISKKGNLNIYLYPSVQFTDEEEAQALTFMVVGETGSGKTTLLNSFINVLLGVEMKDNFRFRIIKVDLKKSQAISQTDNVNYYNIRSVGGYPPVKIIDTPGYGDTREIERDKEIMHRLKNYLMKKSIHLMLFAL